MTTSQDHLTAPRSRNEAGEGGIQPVVIVLLIAIAISAGLSVYTLLQLRSFRDEIQATIGTHEERLALLDGSVARTSSELVSQVGEVKSLVETTEKELAARTRQVEGRAVSLQKELKQEIADTRETTREGITAVGGRLEALQEDTQTKFGDVGGRVETVEKEVDETRTKLQETISELTSVKGDLGVQSGLIATNGDELAALKALGERNYFEFNLGRTNKPQRVGPVGIKVSGTDQKRNRYSIELWADDKRIVKRRKSLLEPVQFYVEGVRIPYELVVNKISRGEIAGYLATPKTAPRGS